MNSIREQKAQQESFLFDKMRTYLSKGYTQRQIATELHLSLAKVNKVVQQLKIEAKTNIQKYVNEELPSSYENTLRAIDQIIKIAWEAVDRADRENSNKDKYPALSLLMQAYEIKLHLLSSAETLREAVSFVDSQRQLQQQQQKREHNREEQAQNEDKATRES